MKHCLLHVSFSPSLPLSFCLSVCLSLSPTLYLCLSVCLFVSPSLSYSLFPPPPLSVSLPISLCLSFPLSLSLSLSQARKYLEALPDSKKPLRDTPGERYWQRQKIKQLPAHDIDLLFCNVLTDEECKQMDVFLKLRKEKFLGRGELAQRTDRNSSSRSWVRISAYNQRCAWCP